MIKGINHLGIVVDNLDNVVAFLQEAFGAKEVTRIDFPKLKQVSAIVRLGESYLEIMQPTAPDGVVGKFLKNRGGGLHHISLLCEDVAALSEELESKGLEVVGKVLDGPTKVAFLHPRTTKGILFELAENEETDKPE
jgi:methylmalonyl-CoA/ethylmalonyl-CoA epimerase